MTQALHLACPQEGQLRLRYAMDGYPHPDWGSISIEVFVQTAIGSTYALPDVGILFGRRSGQIFERWISSSLQNNEYGLP